MTAANLITLENEERDHHKNNDSHTDHGLRSLRPAPSKTHFSSFSSPLTSTTTTCKRKRTSKDTSLPNTPLEWSQQAQVTPSPFHYATPPEVTIDFDKTRPLTPDPCRHYRGGTSTSAHFPLIPHDGLKHQSKGDFVSGSHATAGSAAYEEILPRVAATRGTHAGRGCGGGDDDVGEEENVGDEKKLSRAAKLIEEERGKVASVRSFLLNFLEGRDCSIKKRLVRRFRSGVIMQARFIVCTGLDSGVWLSWPTHFSSFGLPYTDLGIVCIEYYLEGNLDHRVLVAGACNLTLGTHLRFFNTRCATPWCRPVYSVDLC